MSGCGCGGARCRLVAGDERHGTLTGYQHYKCRCDRCREENRSRAARNRAKREPLAPGDPRHGSENGYTNHRCRCALCSAWKSATEAAYYAANRDAVRVRHAASYAANADAAKRRQRRYNLTAEGAASRRARRRRRREYEQYRYCGCDTPASLAAVWALDSGLCAYCGAEGTDYEHVVPLARGGWGCVSNFRIACKSCNSRKGTKPLSVFLAALAASGTPVRPGATNSGLPCPQAAARMATRMLTA